MSVGRGLPGIIWSMIPNFRQHPFQAPLCQATLHEGACRESAMRLLKTASEIRRLRHHSASLRDLPSA
jgi:hypothetical protein